MFVFSACYPSFPKSLGRCKSSRLAQGRNRDPVSHRFLLQLIFALLPSAGKGRPSSFLRYFFCNAVYGRQTEVTLPPNCSALNIRRCWLRKKWWEKIVWRCRVIYRDLQNPLRFCFINPKGSSGLGGGIFYPPGLGSWAIDSPALILSKQRDIYTEQRVVQSSSPFHTLTFFTSLYTCKFLGQVDSHLSLFPPCPRNKYRPMIMSVCFKYGKYVSKCRLLVLSRVASGEGLDCGTQNVSGHAGVPVSSCSSCSLHRCKPRLQM